jgi:hypothetical protein
MSTQMSNLIVDGSTKPQISAQKMKIFKNVKNIKPD